MGYTELTSAKKRTIGTKQTIKALEKGLVVKVFFAEDADRHVVDPVAQLCESKGLPYLWVDSMQALGKACGIEVACAVAAILAE